MAGKSDIVPWYTQRKHLQAIASNIKQFVKFANANADKNEIIFLITSQSTLEPLDDVENATEIVLYVDGVPQIRCFEPPKPPNQVEKVQAAFHYLGFHLHVTLKKQSLFILIVRNKNLKNGK